MTPDPFSSLSQQSTLNLGEEVTRYGPDLFGTVFVLSLGLAALVGSPALGVYLLILKGDWFFFFGSLIPAILMGAPFTYFGAKMFRTQCILYRDGLTYRRFWNTKAIRFENIVAVELSLGSRGAAQMCITVSDGSRFWLNNLQNIDDAAKRIARSAHVQLKC